MANPTPARYTVQLGPTQTPEVAGELGAWAELQQRSVSVVARVLIDDALPRLRKRWEREYGALPAEMLERHTRAAQERGAAQVKRRRDYDDRTRGAAKAAGEGVADDATVAIEYVEVALR